MLTVKHVDHAEGDPLNVWMQLNWVRLSDDPFLSHMLVTLESEVNQRLFPTPYQGPACPLHVVGHDEYRLPIFSLLIPGKMEMRFKFTRVGHWVISVCCAPGSMVHDTFGDLFEQYEQVTAEEASGFDECWLLLPYGSNRQAFTLLLASASDIYIFLFLLGTSLGMRFPYGT